MAKRKFKVKPFKDWLDDLAKVCVKTRDNFTCQFGREGCAGRMIPFDKNCQWCHIQSRKSNNWRWFGFNALTGCGHCHAWAHDKPTEFGFWFAENYPIRNVFLCFPLSNHPWREPDFRDIEARLMKTAVILKVDYMNFPQRFRGRFKAKYEDLKNGH